MLQGEGTDAAAIALLEEAAAQGVERTVELIQYRKGGTPFCDQVHAPSPGCHLPLHVSNLLMFPLAAAPKTRSTSSYLSVPARACTLPGSFCSRNCLLS